MISACIVIISILSWTLLKGEWTNNSLQFGLIIGLLAALFSEALFKQSKLRYRLKHSILFIVHFSKAIITGIGLTVVHSLKSNYELTPHIISLEINTPTYIIHLSPLIIGVIPGITVLDSRENSLDIHILNTNHSILIKQTKQLLRVLKEICI